MARQSLQGRPDNRIHKWDPVSSKNRGWGWLARAPRQASNSESRMDATHEESRELPHQPETYWAYSFTAVFPHNVQSHHERTSLAHLARECMVTHWRTNVFSVWRVQDQTNKHKTTDAKLPPSLSSSSPWATVHPHHDHHPLYQQPACYPW